MAGFVESTLDVDKGHRRSVSSFETIFDEGDQLMRSRFSGLGLTETVLVVV